MAALGVRCGWVARWTTGWGGSGPGQAGEDAGAQLGCGGDAGQDGPSQAGGGAVLDGLAAEAGAPGVRLPGGEQVVERGGRRRDAGLALYGLSNVPAAVLPPTVSLTHCAFDLR